MTTRAVLERVVVEAAERWTDGCNCIADDDGCPECLALIAAVRAFQSHVSLEPNSGGHPPVPATGSEAGAISTSDDAGAGRVCSKCFHLAVEEGPFRCLLGHVPCEPCDDWASAKVVEPSSPPQREPEPASHSELPLQYGPADECEHSCSKCDEAFYLFVVDGEHKWHRGYIRAGNSRDKNKELAAVIVSRYNGYPGLLAERDRLAERVEELGGIIDEKCDTCPVSEAISTINNMLRPTVEWEYAGQVVRDVKDLHGRAESAEARIAELEAEVTKPTPEPDGYDSWSDYVRDSQDGWAAIRHILGEGGTGPVDPVYLKQQLRLADALNAIEIEALALKAAQNRIAELEAQLAQTPEPAGVPGCVERWRDHIAEFDEWNGRDTLRTMRAWLQRYAEATDVMLAKRWARIWADILEYLATHPTPALLLGRDEGDVAVLRRWQGTCQRRCPPNEHDTALSRAIVTKLGLVQHYVEVADQLADWVTDNVGKPQGVLDVKRAKAALPPALRGEEQDDGAETEEL